MTTRAHGPTRSTNKEQDCAKNSNLTSSWPPYFRAHRCKPCLTSLSEIAGRLALTRRVLDLTRFQMARLLGADMPTWGAYEAGLERPNIGPAASTTFRPDLGKQSGRPEARGRRRIEPADPGRSGAQGLRLRGRWGTSTTPKFASQSPSEQIAIRHRCRTSLY